ncbi:MAG: LpxL/LpxP family Kdo(2)-lipid IV(A) lauroyl/palmitoleoyl acyltransferase [Gammaproteobacteria bacterium]|nr:LpxL/LpxP family Kdo(2)-lipid IV(A) lauroyl/palmitoleoyl acyltransferase [Gammaproteobacteria bacterium]
MSMARRKPRTKIYSPRVWGTWLIVGLGWLLARLPLPAVIHVGRVLGRVGYHLADSRRHIAQVNLALCFPELSEAERGELTRQTFQHVAVGALETTLPWLNPNRDLTSHIELQGVEHLHKAQALGRGVVLIGGHFTAMDIISQALKAAVDIDVMYRENKNPVWEWLQVTGRRRYFAGVIERSDTRQTLRSLKAGRTVWYAPDQDYGPKHSVFAPFFGVPAASITATSRLARFNDSPVVFMSHFRHWDTLTWTVTFSPMIDGFPSDDEVADTTLINSVVERAVRQHPAQYLWIHRRFKTRPEGEAKLY